MCKPAFTSYLLELVLCFPELLPLGLQQPVYHAVLVDGADPLAQGARRHAALTHHRRYERRVVVENLERVEDAVWHVLHVVKLQVFEEVVAV